MYKQGPNPKFEQKTCAQRTPLPSFQVSYINAEHVRLEAQCVEFIRKPSRSRCSPTRAGTGSRCSSLGLPPEFVFELGHRDTFAREPDSLTLQPEALLKRAITL